MNASMTENLGNVFNAPQCGQRALQISADANFDHSGRGVLRRNREDHGTAFVADYVGLVSAYPDGEAAATIRARGAE